MQIIKPYDDTIINEHAAKVGGRRNLREICICTESEEFVFLVKVPTRNVIQAISAANQKNDVNAASKLLIGCVLEGDKEVIENDGSVYLALVEQITSLLGGVKANIKKL